MRELMVREATVDASAPVPGPALRVATPAAARTRPTRSVTCSLSQSQSWTAASHSEERLMLSWHNRNIIKSLSQIFPNIRA